MSDNQSVTNCVNCGHEIEWQGVNLVHKNVEYTQCTVDKCGCNDPSEIESKGGDNHV